MKKYNSQKIHEKFYKEFAAAAVDANLSAL